MTAATNIDIRVIVAGLAANTEIGRPLLITATGRAAPSSKACAPSPTQADFALMPDIDYEDDPECRPGCGFSGGRLSSFALFSPSPLSSAVQLRELPQSRAELLSRLRTSAGLHWAPGSLFALAAWEDEWVATLFDHLRRGGEESRLVMAHCQAMLALRKAWLAVIWNQPPSSDSNLARISGAAALGRALIDVLAAVDALRLQTPATIYTTSAIARLMTCWDYFLTYLTAADYPARGQTARAQLKLALTWAKRLLDGIAMFVVAPENPQQRWYRLDQALGEAKAGDHTGPLAPKLTQAGAQLEKLDCAALGKRLEATGWRPHIHRALLRLAEPRAEVRMAHLKRLRGDLIYALALTGQLDRLYRLFPWLAAPHGAFPGCAGGALGALATLFECGRLMQICRELKRRLSDDETGPGSASRLTAPAARAIAASPSNTLWSVKRNGALGRELLRNAISHMVVSNALAGATFGPHALLTHSQAGSLGWNEHAALADRTVLHDRIELAKATPTLEANDHDNDVPRFMGMTIIRLINAGMLLMFPTGARRGDVKAHRDRARDAAHRAGRPHSDPSGFYDGLTQLQNTMLLTLDRDPALDPHLRDGIADDNIDDDMSDACDGVAGDNIDDCTPHVCELDRSNALQDNPTRNSDSYYGHMDGRGRRDRAGDEMVNAGQRGAQLRKAIEGARLWRVPRTENKMPPQDDLLEDLLLGRTPVPGFQPVSDLFIPVLWFAPLIDRPLLRWIGIGAPISPNMTNHLQAAISHEVGRVHAWAQALYANGLDEGRVSEIACHLFTGLSPVTCDPAHAVYSP